MDFMSVLIDNRRTEILSAGVVFDDCRLHPKKIRVNSYFFHCELKSHL